MILFEYQTCEEPVTPFNTFTLNLKLPICLIMKVVIIFINIHFIHVNKNLVMLLIESAILVILLELITFFCNWFNLIEKEGLTSIANSSNELTSLSEDSELELEIIQDNKFKGINWLPTLFWHLIMIVNSCVVVFGIEVSMERYLVSYTHKIRYPLCILTLMSTLGLFYFVKFPYFENRMQNSKIGEERKGCHVVVFRRYQNYQIVMMKFWLLAVCFGSIFDYIYYGTSDTVSFLLNGSLVTLNAITAIISIFCILFYFGSFLIRKFRVWDGLKELWDSE